MPRQIAGALIGLAVLLASTAAEAFCLPASNDLAGQKEQVQLIEAIVRSLLSAKIAGDRVKPDDSIGSLLVGLHTRRADYRCAVQALEPFVGSQTLFVAEVSKDLHEHLLAAG